jgi:MYXO-CTERM domain-containing protein
MKLSHALLLAVPVAALAITDARDAAACGGCFVPPEESTQVTGHRMLLSVSPTETTLWDQISYSGNPSSFAWILPTKGIVEVGLSSDALFAFVEQATSVTIAPPPLNCPGPPDGCQFPGGVDDGFGASAGAGGGSASGGVTVVAQATVGPYETVQLKSDDPTALKSWLAMHNFSVPADVQPIIDAYVADHFDFLALKLVPGQGLDSMRPVRVTSPGASPTLPLRMVAAGTGALTPITLWVLGEGRYETANFDNFTIEPSSVVWNWDTQSSSYTTLKQAGFAKNAGLGWLTEAARPTSSFELTDNLIQVAQNNAGQSGYGDSMGMGAVEEATADADKLLGNIAPSSLWITRLHAELPRAALGKDLEVGASMTQTPVANFIQTAVGIGTPPACPIYDCGVDNGSGSGFFGNGIGNKSSAKCDISVGGSGDGGTAAIGGLGALVALAMVRRRKSR